MDLINLYHSPGLERCGGFTTTHWSVILEACRQGASDAQSAALERLCKSYRYPLYVHARRLGWRPEEAEDMTQEFLVHFIQRGLPRADPLRGRFRSFLLTSLKHFLADEWKKLHAEKRGGGRPILRWDDSDPEERYRLDPLDELTPELAYAKRWAVSLLESVLNQVQADYAVTGRLEEFDVLKEFVWGDAEASAHGEAAAQLNMRDGTFRVNLHRLRKEFGRRLRQEIQLTVSTPEEVDDELRYLQALFSR